MQFKTLAGSFHVNIRLSELRAGVKRRDTQSRQGEVCPQEATSARPSLQAGPRRAARNRARPSPVFPSAEPQTFPRKSLVARWLLTLQTVQGNRGEDKGGEASRTRLVQETSWNGSRQSWALPF